MRIDKNKKSAVGYDYCIDSYCRTVGLRRNFRMMGQRKICCIYATTISIGRLSVSRLSSATISITRKYESLQKNEYMKVVL